MEDEQSIGSWREKELRFLRQFAIIVLFSSISGAVMYYVGEYNGRHNQLVEIRTCIRKAFSTEPYPDFCQQPRVRINQ